MQCLTLLGIAAAASLLLRPATTYVSEWKSKSTVTVKEDMKDPPAPRSVEPEVIETVVQVAENDRLAEAEKALSALEETETMLRERMNASFQVVTSKSPDGALRFWRDTPSGREYFVVVSIKKDKDETLAWAVEDMDTGTTHAVTSWAVKISEREYATLADAAAPDEVIGIKKSGVLDLYWNADVTGDMLVDWKRYTS